jgi:hypothetical protein
MRDSRGFALIEVAMEGLAVSALLLVVALFGVQSSMVASDISATRAQARFDAMKWDLENLADWQALHFADNATFSNSIEDLRFTPTEGVKISLEASATGWSGVATFDGLSAGEGCAIHFGNGPLPTGPVTPAAPREVACTQ